MTRATRAAPRWRPATTPPTSTRGVDGLRIGVVPGYFFHHLQPPVDAAVRGALKTLEGLGARVMDVEIDHIHGNISAQLTVESCEPSTYHQRWLRERPEDYGEDVRLLLEIGELHLATHYIQAQRYRSLLRAQFLDAFKTVDVFICPALPFTATRVGETTVQIERGVDEDMLSAIMQFTGVPSLDGAPVARRPVRVRRRRAAGRDADHRPPVRRGAAVPRRRRVPGRNRLPHPDARRCERRWRMI